MLLYHCLQHELELVPKCLTATSLSSILSISDPLSGPDKFQKMRYSTTPEKARQYHYWRGFLTASILLGIPFIVLVVMCNTIINSIVK